ncbi:hypothetical protein [Coleofasciculus sp. E2-BRE-01]|uniref:hypothetical protein n=1 Tax=Coleofasciculus sp. E2-BRE-01 TaxID=3069524 RepID=UPI0033008186
MTEFGSIIAGVLGCGGAGEWMEANLPRRFTTQSSEELWRDEATETEQETKIPGKEWGIETPFSY